MGTENTPGRRGPRHFQAQEQGARKKKKKNALRRRTRAGGKKARASLSLFRRAPSARAQKREKTYHLKAARIEGTPKNRPAKSKTTARLAIKTAHLARLMRSDQMSKAGSSPARSLANAGSAIRQRRQNRSTRPIVSRVSTSRRACSLLCNTANVDTAYALQGIWRGISRSFSACGTLACRRSRDRLILIASASVQIRPVTICIVRLWRAPPLLILRQCAFSASGIILRESV